MENISPKFIIFIGIGITILGLVWSILGDKINFLGKLPGDISYRDGNYGFHFPWVTCIVLSIVVNVFIWIFRKF
ncbi:MAG: DUF2905 domain-containing protein [Leadbetterella sp.]